MRIDLPDFCLVLLIGASGSGKSRLAKRLFKPDEVLSSDFFRKLVSGDEGNQEATEDAFDCLYKVAQKRLNRRKLTVIDATNLKKSARMKAFDFAKTNNCFCVGIVLNLPESECQQNNEMRLEKAVPRRVIARQCKDLRHSLKWLKKENFRQLEIINSAAEADALEIERIPLLIDKSALTGPFDIIGDVHGCFSELCELLRKMSYQVNEHEFSAIPPAGRMAIFLGDLCDRGPASVPVLRLVMNMLANGHALCVPGNHDDKLARYLAGSKVQVAHGLENTLAELEKEDEAFRKSVKEFLHRLISHYVLDAGNLVVCHAGLPAHMHGRSSKKVREFCLYGDPSGEVDEYGLPVRKDWTRDYKGKALVVYGHSPEPEARILNNTICLDAGCVFGGQLMALRYPERELISVAAAQEYYHSPKPLEKRAKTSLPDAQVLLKRQYIETGLGIGVVRDEERSLEALEIMGRFAADPRWLIYLPPTMSPCESSSLPNYLEHPLEALDYYRARGIKKVICQEKHMGSRAIAIICKDEKSTQEHFVPTAKQCGIILTRTGRPFFTASQEGLHEELLRNISEALNKSGFWEKYSTDWVCLDCELMPWSFKAQSLLANQYAPYGSAGSNGLEASLKALENFKARWHGTADSSASEEVLLMEQINTRLQEKREAIADYNKVWQSYCSPVTSIEDIRIAPFHILATEKKVWSEIGHDQQLQIINQHLGQMPNFTSTRNKIIDLEDEAQTQEACIFWDNLLADGAEGMVVKPLEFIPFSGDKLIQPAIKCRGKDYLRIIYGAEYLRELTKFKQRNLAGKRKRALKEFALGLRALEHFVAGDSLDRIHECVFTILALESEPQDLRL